LEIVLIHDMMMPKELSAYSLMFSSK